MEITDQIIEAIGLPITHVNEETRSQSDRDYRARVSIGDANHRHKLVRLRIPDEILSYNQLLIPHTAIAVIGFLAVTRSANHQHTIRSCQTVLHEMGEITTEGNIPLVKDDIDALSTKPTGQTRDPFLVLR